MTKTPPTLLPTRSKGTDAITAQEKYNIFKRWGSGLPFVLTWCFWPKLPVFHGRRVILLLTGQWLA